MSDYPISPRNRIKRAPIRGSYDRATIHGVLDAGLLAHIAYVIDDQPFSTPTAYWRDGDTLYWHGSAASRMLEHQAEGVPVCVTVAHLDGLVLARSGFHCSMNYRSVMAFGTARVVADLAHKRAALDAFVERLFPGRTAEMRAMTDQEVKATLVVAMEIEEASAKIRTGPPKDDEDDYAAPLWAGVLPMQQRLDPPIPCPRLAPGTAMAPSATAYEAGRGFDAVMAAQAGGEPST